MFTIYPSENAAVAEYVTGLAGSGVDECIKADGASVSVIGALSWWGG